MNYQFLNKNLNTNDLVLPNSANIDSFLIKNNKKEILKALNFVNSENKFLYLHGFLGTGKRQFINYIKEFIDKNVIKLEYYCKESTVCDDILLNFNNLIENLNSTKIINTKITTLAIKFQQYISSIKKPFLIVLY